MIIIDAAVGVINYFKSGIIGWVVIPLFMGIVFPTIPFLFVMAGLYGILNYFVKVVKYL